MIDFIESARKTNNKEIDYFEKKYKIILPDEYKRFLINIGGGDLKDNFGDIEYFYYDKEGQKYELNHFLSLDEIYQENITWGNKEPQKSSLLIFAQLYNNCFYCICINKKSSDYGKIYYRESGYHAPFEHFILNKDDYKDLPLLENNFNDFISNIKK